MHSNYNTLNNRYNHQMLISPSQQTQGNIPFRNNSPASKDYIQGSDQSRHSSTVNLNAPLSTFRVTPDITEERKQMWNQHKLFRGFAEDDHQDHEEHGKMKASQFTAVTHAETQLQKSRILQQSRVGFSQLDKAEPPRELTNSFISSLPNINFQGAKPINTYVHAPQESGSTKSGYLLKDNEVDKLVMGALVNYLQKLKSKTEPFYENQTCIKAEDQSFEFKLSFKYEGDNIVFDWQSKRNYPHQEYLERKYECFNYFVVEVFPDHIQLFNDFTVQPFVYSKALEDYCIRTQLRTFIPLDDPSKAVTVKYAPSEAATSQGSHSRLNANK